MEPELTKEDYAQIEKLITSFCNIILTKKDELDFDSFKNYIDSLSENDKTLLNLEGLDNDTIIRFMVQSQIAKYLESYTNFEASNSIKRPFEFDSGGKYNMFFKKCKEYYKKKNANANLPPVICFTLRYIQEMSEHYRIFGCFYEVRYKETSSKILEDVTEIAENKTKLAVQSATQKSAEEAVKNVIASKMNEVTKNISETSVTILSIFSGIVLTAVGGLMYSSSAIQSVSNANFFKLMSVVALVGFVCTNLFVVMFGFIGKIKTGNDTMTKTFTKSSSAISAILLLIMIIFAIAQYYLPEHKISQDNSTQTQNNTEHDNNTEVNTDITIDETVSETTEDLIL